MQNNQTTIKQFFHQKTTTTTTTPIQTQNKKRTKKQKTSPNQKKEKKETEPTTTTTTCPICETQLKNQTQLEIQTHVNHCLDQPTSSKLLSPTINHPSLHDQDDIQIIDHLPPTPSCSKLENRTVATKSSSSSPPRILVVEEKKKLRSNVKPTTRGENRGQKEKSNNVPFYKFLPGTRMTVDAFKYGKIPNVTCYFLSHAHSDHYTKLNSKWNHGNIYCSKITANFIKFKLKVDSKWINPLEFNIKYSIDDVDVTLISANHCPGSAMFLFEGITKDADKKKDFKYLHCGDFRATPRQLNHTSLKNKQIDICFLDTTYLDPQYCFPAQDQVIEGTCKFIQSRILQLDHHQQEENNSSILSSKFSNNHNNLEKSKLFFKSWLNSSSSPAAAVLEKKKNNNNNKSCQKIDEVGVHHDVTLGQNHHAEEKEEIIEGAKESEEIKKTLIVVGTYSIGKERIVIKLAEILKTSIFCSDPKKFSLLKSILIDTPNQDGDGDEDEDQDGKIKKFLSDDPVNSQIHIVNLFNLKQDFLKSYLKKFHLHFSNVIGIKPTGWTFKQANNNKNNKKLQSDSNLQSRTPININANEYKNLSEFIHKFQFPFINNSQTQTQDESFHFQLSSSSCSNFNKSKSQEKSPVIEILSIPYSEHSSFFELSCFCISLNWKKIIPTVNVGSVTSRDKMKLWIDRWKKERDRLLLLEKEKEKEKEEGGMDIKNSTTSSHLLITPRDVNYW